MASVLYGSKIVFWKKSINTPVSIPKIDPEKKNLNTTDMGGACFNERPF
jgi:hypothetical protein